MRLEEYDVKYPLIYTPGDIESMRNALSEYTELILSGEAFENEYCVAHFSHSCEKVSITYFQEYPVYLMDEISKLEDIERNKENLLALMPWADTLPEELKIEKKK